MYAWESIQIAVDYIEAHCGEEIRIEDLASACHLSKFYFQRLFQRRQEKALWSISDYGVWPDRSDC